ncbi:MAG: hypothetical protein JNM69_15650 [Archangium sp.]|nr:hypothetical protein [Archangium sp.]
MLATLSATWRRGFLQSVRAPNWEGLRLLLTHPSGALLEELVLDNPRLAMDEQLDLVATARPPLLRIVVRSDDSGTQFHGLIDVGGVLRIPTLEEGSFAVYSLELGGRGPAFSNVTRLELSVPELPWRRFDTWTFGNLRELELSTMTTTGWRDNRGFFAIGHRPFVEPESGVQRLAAGSVTPAFESLRLDGFLIDQTSAVFLLALSTHTPLRVLDLRQCRLEPEAELLSTLKCSVLLPSPKEP